MSLEEVTRVEKILKTHDSGCVVKDHTDGILVECPNGMRLIVCLYENDVVVRPVEDTFRLAGIETLTRPIGVQFSDDVGDPI